MELHIVSEANRCLNCKKPVCQQGCPIHTPIPQVIQLFKQGKLTEAGQILFENNPLSAICALICNHEQQCAGHCVLGKKSTPVHFSSIENYISEFPNSACPKACWNATRKCWKPWVSRFV